MSWLLALALSLSVARAAPGTEIVLVLDNSGSMIRTVSGRGGTVPPADPERRSVLGTLLLDGMTRDSQDHLTVLTFDAAAPDHTRVLPPGDGLRTLPVSGSTLFLGPLARAREILEKSSRDDKLLVFLSDGAPNDYRDPRRGPEVLGLDRREVPFQTLIMSLIPEGSDGEAARQFMRPLALDPADWVQVRDSADLVERFTDAFARAQGARPLTGRLAQGRSLSFEVGPHVSEVMVLTASAEPTGPYQATLVGPRGEVRPRASGDNGCDLQLPESPHLCDPPRMHYRVWRQPHQEGSAGSYTLANKGGSGEIAYGVILRYDLVARIEVPQGARVGDEVPLRAWLETGGEPFLDEVFFGEEGFAVTASVSGASVPLTPQPDGSFTGLWRPQRASGEHPELAAVRFHNTWLDRTATAEAQVQGRLELVLRPQPEVLELGRWRGARRPTERCADLDLSASTNIRLIPLDVQFEGIPGDAIVSLTPLDLGSAREGEPSRWRACVQVPACPDDLSATDQTAIVLRGDDPFYHQGAVRVPLRFAVNDPGLLACWWPWLLALATLILLGWVVVGIARPHGFDPEQTMQIAGSERQLGRAAGLVLREQPGGRRGFYRDARVAITGTGDFVKGRRQAALVLVAGAGGAVLPSLGALERRDRRTRQWVAVEAEERLDGLRAQEIYRLGNLYLKLQ
ncbi:MAG: VWA domain-containing protein [Deltaproteobacteria bacterium]|nr:VWA domain-containing protein [Deltaproteobacteria bacterium]